MLDWRDAQALVDGLCAVGLGASALAILGRPSPLRSRLAFAFAGLCLFFAFRAASAASGWPGLGLATLVIACALPLAALLLAEGVLRRHAPRPLKLLTAGGAIAATAAILATGGARPTSDWILGLYVVASLLGVTLLLLGRQRAGLSGQENARAAALTLAGALVTLAAATDFLPSAPVGLSGIGAAAVAFVFTANPTSARDARGALGELALLAGLAILATPALAPALGLGGPAPLARLAAVLTALLLAGDALTGLARRGAVPDSRSLARALGGADLGSLDSFLEALADQPLLAGLRIAEGSQLADYDAAGLGPALMARPVWTPALAAAGAAQTRALEELADLMARAEATHALLVSATPLRIALLTLPEGGPAVRQEADLALFGRLAGIAAGGHR